MSHAIADLRLGRRIGRGGSAEVWACEHVPTGVKLAAKRVVDASDDLIREVRAVAALDHPGVLAVLDLVRVEPSEGIGTEWVGSQLLVMERAVGSLVDFPTRDVRDLADQLLQALAHVHARGLVHSDIKPGNVLVGRDQHYKLADFGLARPVDTPIQEASGTLRYMSPEQVRRASRELGPASDLYSLGILLFEAIFGYAPFQGTPATVMRSHVERPLPFPVDADLDVVHWIGRLTEKEPSNRFASAAEARAALPSKRAFEACGVAIDGPEEASTFTWDEPPTPSTGSVPEFQPLTSERIAVPIPDRPVQSPESRLWVPGTGLGLWGLRTPRVIGRSVVQEQLWASLVSVVRDEVPRAVVIRGAAGLGKSHLARWLVSAAVEHAGAHAMTAVHDAGCNPLLPVADLLNRDLRCQGLEDDELRRHLGRSLGLHSESADVRRMAAAVRGLGRDVVPAAGQHVRRRAGRQPVALWIDDAQWGPSACSLAKRLLGDEVPVLLVLTARPESIPELDAVVEHAGCVHVELDPLDLRATEDLVGDALHVTDVVAKQVAERAEGNPLFAVQLVSDLVRRGVLVPSGSGFDLAPDASVDLPDDLLRTWLRRVDHALEDAPGSWRAALDAAAMLGRDVDLETWDAVLAKLGMERPTELPDHLTQAELWQPGEGTAWSFVHGLLPEALVHDVAHRGEARELHLACDAVLGDPGRRRYRDAQRAWHREALGDLDGAAVLLARGSSIEAARISIAEGRKLLDRAQNLAATLDPSAELKAELALADARLSEISGAAAEGVAKHKRNLEVLDRDTTPRVYALTLHHVGVIGGLVDPPWAMEQLKASIPLLEAEGLQDQADSSRGILATRLLRTGRVDEGRALLEDVEEVTQFNVLLARGQLLSTDGHLDEADAALARAAVVAADTGHRTWLVDTHLLRCDVAHKTDDPDRALEHIDAAIGILEDLGSHEVNNMRANKGLVLLHWERLDEAEALFEDVRPSLTELGALRMRRVVDCARVHIAVRRGRTAAAILDGLVETRDTGRLEPGAIALLSHPDVVHDADVAAFLEGVP